jgi:hypothetical protein
MRTRFSHPLKHDAQIVSIDDGIQIEPSTLQYENTESPSRETWQPRSNVNLESFTQ